MDPLADQPAPKLKAPRGTTDCHIHVYDERLPLAPTAKFKPPHAPVEDYLKVCKLLGIERTVVVAPTAYGTDNTLLLDTMKKIGPGARGVVTVDNTTSDAEFERLTKLGVRGVRFFMLPGGALPWDILEPMSKRLGNIGWHIVFQTDGRNYADHEAILGRLGCPVIVDHVGKFLEPVPADHPGVKTLLRLLDKGRIYLKLAAPYETSKLGPPYYDDVGVLAKAFVKAAPERIVWASNWPHPNFKPKHAWMLDMLLDWVPDEKTRHKVLVDNPARLYGY